MTALPPPEAHLLAVEPRFEPLIRAHGPLTLTQRPVTFHSLATSILGQQISVKAADAIQRKLTLGLGLPESGSLEENAFTGHTIDTLRPFGLSRQKATYILDLAERSRNGLISWTQLPEKSNEDIIAELTAVKGIGLWTVQMILMFDLARPDILPALDLGIQEGLRRFDAAEHRLKPKQIEARCAPWAPYRTYASLYLWHLKDKP